MKRPFVSSICIKSGAGWRVTYYDKDHEPVVSLWGVEPLLLNREAGRHVEKCAAGRPNQ